MNLLWTIKVDLQSTKQMPISNSTNCKFQTSNRISLNATNIERYLKASIIGAALLCVASCGWNENLKALNLTAIPLVRSAVNGTYAAHSADGEIYKLDLNFEDNLYAWRGIAADKRPSSGSIVEIKSSGMFNLIANDPNKVTNQIRYMDNVLIGDFDFGSGSLPFVAIRTIENSPKQLTILHTGHDMNTLSERLTELNTIGSD